MSLSPNFASSTIDHDLVEVMPVALMVLHNGKVSYANAACLAVLEAATTQEVLGRPVVDFIAAVDQPLALQRMRRLQPGDKANAPNQVRVLTCQGNVRTLLLTSMPIRHGGQDGLLITAMDMSDHSAMQERVRVSEENFRRLFENMQDVYYRTDALGVVQTVGPGVRRVLGFEPEEIIGRTAESYYPHSSDRDAFKQAILEKGEVSDFPGQMVRKDGRVIDISISSHALYDENGRYCGVEGIYRDVTQRKNLERALHRLATVDALTNIANRRAFLEQAGQAFSAAQRYQTPLALLILDLDHFKSINDHRGHAAGDEVLSRFTQTVSAELRDSDLFGRVGGEEFCILLQQARPAESALVAERIRQAVQAQAFVDAAGQAYAVTVSIGITHNLAGDTHIQELIERADKALYLAKRNGRNQVQSDSALDRVSA